MLTFLRCTKNVVFRWVFSEQKWDLCTLEWEVLWWFHIGASKPIKHLSLPLDRSALVDFCCKSFVIFWCEFHLALRVHPKIHFLSGKYVMIIDRNDFHCISFREQCVCPVKSFKEILPGFSSVWGSIFISFISFNSLKIRVSIWVWCLILPGYSGVGNQNVLFCCSVWFVLRS